MNTMAVTSRNSTNSSSSKATASSPKPSAKSTVNPPSKSTVKLPSKSSVSIVNPPSPRTAASSRNTALSKPGESATSSFSSNDHNDQNHVLDHDPFCASTSRGVKRLAEGRSETDLINTSTSSNTIDNFEEKNDLVSSVTTSTRSSCDRVPADPNRVEASFDSALVESEVRRIVSERLHLVKYEPYSCKRLSQDLAAELMERLKNLQYANYKIVVMVSLGNRAEAPGLQFGSRCLWNAKTDRLIYVKHTNGSVYAVILVYALHFS